MRRASHELVAAQWPIQLGIRAGALLCFSSGDASQLLLAPPHPSLPAPFARQAQPSSPEHPSPVQGIPRIPRRYVRVVHRDSLVLELAVLLRLKTGSKTKSIGAYVSKTTRTYCSREMDRVSTFDPAPVPLILLELHRTKTPHSFFALVLGRGGFRQWPIGNTLVVFRMAPKKSNYSASHLALPFQA